MLPFHKFENERVMGMLFLGAVRVVSVYYEGTCYGYGCCSLNVMAKGILYVFNNSTILLLTREPPMLKLL